MANARRQEASARLKKFYSTISQASMKAKAMGNDWEEWTDAASTDSDLSSQTPESFAQRYLLPYLNYTDTAKDGRYYYIYLSDGTYFFLHKGDCIDFRYDLNGPKKPNMYGKDKFTFLYCPYNKEKDIYVATGRVIPYQLKDINSREKALEECRIAPSHCSTLLMMDGWEFKKDYPYNI